MFSPRPTSSSSVLPIISLLEYKSSGQGLPVFVTLSPLLGTSLVLHNKEMLFTIAGKNLILFLFSRLTFQEILPNRLRLSRTHLVH